MDLSLFLSTLSSWLMKEYLEELLDCCLHVSGTKFQSKTRGIYLILALVMELTL